MFVLRGLRLGFWGAWKGSFAGKPGKEQQLAVFFAFLPGTDSGLEGVNGQDSRLRKRAFSAIRDSTHQSGFYLRRSFTFEPRTPLPGLPAHSTKARVGPSKPHTPSPSRTKVSEHAPPNPSHVSNAARARLGRSAGLGCRGSELLASLLGTPRDPAPTSPHRGQSAWRDRRVADRASEPLQGFLLACCGSAPQCPGLLPDLLKLSARASFLVAGVGGVCTVTRDQGLFDPTDFDEACAPPTSLPPFLEPFRDSRLEVGRVWGTGRCLDSKGFRHIYIYI